MYARFTAAEIRIVLIGKTGVGKSSTGNSILGKDVFNKAASSKSVTKECHLASAVVDGRTITIVDTPGMCDTDLSEHELTQEIVKCIDISCPGPHVFLIVLKIGNRYTSEEKDAVQKIQEIFGEGATRYTIILFTGGDNLDGTFDDYLNDAEQDLQALIAQCDRRCNVFNNRNKSNRSQVSELLQNIQVMVQCNGGECFTNTTYQLLEKYKRREAELQREADAARREKEAREAEIRRLTRVEQEHQKLLNSFARMSFRNNMREEERTQGRLNAQAAEHQRTLELQQQRYMREEMQRTQEESRNKRRLEQLEREKQEIQMRYEATVDRLEEQKQWRQTELENLKSRIKKKKKCIIS